MDPREITVTGFAMSDFKQGVALMDPNTPPGMPPVWGVPVTQEMFERRISSGTVVPSG